MADQNVTAPDDAGFNDLVSQLAPESAAVVQGKPAQANDDAGFQTLLSELAPESHTAVTGIKMTPAAAAPAIKPVSQKKAAPRPQVTKDAVKKTADADLPDLTWRQVLDKSKDSFLPSGKKAVMGVVDAVKHPIETVDNITQLGAGLISKGMGAAGFPRSQRYERVADAFGAQKQEEYGGLLSGDTRRLKNTLANDPFTPIMDASSVAGGAGLLARGAGMSRVASGLGKLSTATDPVQAALAVAKVPVKGIAKANRAIQSGATGVPYSALEYAANAGKNGTAAERAAFTRFHKGADVSEMATAMNDAVRTVERNSWDRVRNTRAGIFASNPGSMAHVINDADRALGGIESEMALRQTQHNDYFPQTQAAVNQLRGLVDRWQQAPRLQNLQGLNELREAVGDILHSPGTNKHLNERVGRIYNIIRDGMPPELVRSLEDASNTRRSIKELQQVLGAGDKATVSAATKKMLASMKNSRGQDLLRRVAEVDSRIPYMIAGHATKDWMPGGMRGMLEGFGASTGIPLALVMQPHLWPHILGGAAAAAVSASPKLAAKTQYWGGKGAKVASHATSPAVTKSAYYSGQLPREDVPEEAPQEESPPLPGQDAQNDAGRVFGRMMTAESQNRQFTESGEPVVSPRGALGIAQVMPDTGPEAAALAGEEWSLDRLKTDADYNLKLGRAYFDKMVEKFSDPILAAAAYNAGPGRVEKAIAKSIRNGDEWTNYIPEETKDYIRKVSVDRVERKSGGRTSINHSSEAFSLIRKAEMAKRVHGKHTQVLLTVPDDHIAKALAVANKSV